MIDLYDIELAHITIKDATVETPLLESEALNACCGRRVLIKAENLQHTGSFKLRGAFNRLSAIPTADRPRGVVGWSSGNHGLAVAYAAHRLSMPAVVLVPSDAPNVKLRRIRALGGEIVPYDRDQDDREAMGRALAAQLGATLVPSSDDLMVIAGQGTIGLEFNSQASALGASLDAMLINAAGGGLLAGVCVAMAALSPKTRIFSVEPDGHDDVRRSLIEGRRCANAETKSSICDALLVRSPGRITFSLFREKVAAGRIVTDDEVLVAMRLAYVHLGLMLEPSGAVGLASALAGEIPGDGPIGVVLTGGNIELDDFRRLTGIREIAAALAEI